MAKANFINFGEDEAILREAGIIAGKTLTDENNIEISNDAAIATIASVYLESLFKLLNSKKSLGGEVSVNFGDLMTVGITCLESEDGEKDANFTPYIKAGIKFKTDHAKADGQSESDD